MELKGAPEKISPVLESEKMKISLENTNKTLGINIDEKKINYYFDLDDDTSLAKKVVNFNIKNVERFNSNVEIINKYLEESLKFNKTVIICLSTINVNNFINF